MRDTKQLLKYIVQRILLMIFTFLVIFFICFVLIRLLPIDQNTGPGQDPEVFYKTQVNMGRMYKGSDGNYYSVPIMTQLWNFIKNLIVPSKFQNADGTWQEVSRWGYSWQISWMSTPMEILGRQLPPTILINIYSMIIAIPIGIGLGIYMALKKNKWQDSVLSVVVMLFISVPSFIYAFLLQYLFAYKWNVLPLTRADYDGSWFTGEMIRSMILPVMAMSFGSIAGFARYTRAELTEVLTSDFMLLARTKGLSRAQATIRHAFRNSLVPIFPMILGEIISVLSGSIIIESIFQINGVGSLFLSSINLKDYDVFQFVGMFYVLIGLVGSLVVDVSYGIVDPRIRMGGGK